jgi:chromosome segregation ATPase
MGWASYLEDITARFAEAFDRFDSQVDRLATGPEPAANLAAIRAEVRGLRAESQALLDELVSYLDLATSPDVDLAAELEAQQEQAIARKHALDEAEKSHAAKCKEYERQLATLRDALRKEKDRRKAAEKELGQLNELLRADPSAFAQVLDAGYLTDRRLQRDKPGETQTR